MCATGMESVDEELNAVLQGHQLNPTHASLLGVVSTASTVASSLAAVGEGRGFGEGQQSFSAELPQAMLGPGATRPYNDSGTKANMMSAQTMNMYPDQSGRNNFGPSTPIAPKNGIRRQGLWSAGNRNYMNGDRNGEHDIDTRLQVPDYPSALLDQSTIPMSDPFRPSGGGLSRYHSAPSSFLAGLAADFRQDNALSSFFSDADLPPLNPPSDTSLEHMDTEQASSALFDDKFLLNTRKFERIGTQGVGGGSGAGGGGGLVSQKSLQSSFKPSMEVVLENPVVAPQMPSNSQISPSSQISTLSSSLGMPSNMGLVQQQMNNSQGGQQINPLANLNLTGSLSFSTGLGSDFISNGPQGALGAHQNNSRPSNLLRQSSSPAGLLAQLSIDVKNQMPKSEKQSLSSPVAQSPEDSLSAGTSEENVGTAGMMSGMDVGSAWEDAANSYMNSWGADTFSARKRFRENMDLGDLMVSTETSGRGSSIDHGPVPGSLTRHMSLPTPKSKAVLPDDSSVACRIRAKRGCATHPRSIAERVRRTRISERMRKLQELVPNMDKQQTNTADMLDEAVEYVKQLQRQVQELTESQAKCNGSCHQDHKASVT